MNEQMDVLTLMERFKQTVLTILRVMRVPQQDMPDLYHDVWVSVLRNRDKHHGLTHVINPENWVAEITRNTAFSFHRRRLRRKAEWYGEDISLRPMANARENAFAQIELNDIVETFKMSAPLEVVAVYGLVCERGLKEGEAAKRLGISISTLRRRLKVAGRRFLRMLGQSVPWPKRSIGRPPGGRNTTSLTPEASSAPPLLNAPQEVLDAAIHLPLHPGDDLCRTRSL